jgi:hypothetical protein
MLPAPGKDEYIGNAPGVVKKGLMQAEMKKISYKKALLVCTGRAV